MSSVYAVLGGRPIGRTPDSGSGYPGSSPGLPANLSPCRRRTCRFPPIPISPVPTKNLVGQPPEVIRTACPSPFGTIRRASVLPQKTKVRIANGHTARSAFPHERLQASLRSGSFARVKVMQAADFRNLDHLTERRKLDRSADGRIFFERQMRTASFVVFEIILQNPAQPGLMENNDVIRHSRRMEPTSRSAKGFCHGDRGAARTSRMPIDFAVSQNFSPYTRSRSRSK